MNDQQKENGTGLARLQRAVRCSSAGLAAAWKNEEAFRQELLVGLVLLPLGLWLGDSGVERALLAASVILVFIVEMLNSAVEAVAGSTGRGDAMDGDVSRGAASGPSLGPSPHSTKEASPSPASS